MHKFSFSFYQRTLKNLKVVSVVSGAWNFGANLFAIYIIWLSLFSPRASNIVYALHVAVAQLEVMFYKIIQLLLLLQKDLRKPHAHAG